MAPDDDEYDDDDRDRTVIGVDARTLVGEKSERDRPYVIVLAGPNVGEMYAIEGAESFVGRGEKATIRLGDDSISRRHVRIVVDGKDVRIEDLGSANGTVLNGERVTTAPLRDGDKIQLGATTILKFTFHDKLEERYRRQMYDAALRDPLTKAFNKKYLLDRLTAELAFARRHQVPLALVMLDVDNFKNVNDTWGHLAGDHVLGKLATTVQAILRTEDVFGRYGGEEFAILCRSATPLEASVLAERIRATVQETSFASEGRAISVTVSLGVAGYPGVEASTPAELIAAADQALYEAKSAGRNRVVVRRGS
jgi:two-component system, cell cycle response regulator